MLWLSPRGKKTPAQICSEGGLIMSVCLFGTWLMRWSSEILQNSVFQCPGPEVLWREHILGRPTLAPGQPTSFCLSVLLRKMPSWTYPPVGIYLYFIHRYTLLSLHFFFFGAAILVCLRCCCWVPFTGHVNFDPLIKVVSARLCHRKVTIPLRHEYVSHREITWDYVNIRTFDSHTFITSSRFHWWFSPESVMMLVDRWWFSSLIFLSILIGIVPKGRTFLSLLWFTSLHSWIPALRSRLSSVTHSFCCLNCPRLDPQDLHHVGLQVVLMCPDHSLKASSFKTQSVLSSPGISHFTKQPWSLLVENCI